MLDNLEFSVIIQKFPAGVAHPVERHLAKVEVASSSLVTRSIKEIRFGESLSFLPCTIAKKVVDISAKCAIIQDVPRV